MEKYRAIPQGYMTVGELAKKMNTTVRTLQYYDKEGVLSPSAESDGGRRLYTDKDIIKLHQIQSMKYLGFSLADIKNRLVFLDTTVEVADALTEQAEVIREKAASLAEALEAIEKLKSEILKMKTVDWKKYADIIVLLQRGNESYWIIKYFDDKMLGYISNRYDEENSFSVVNTWNRLCDEAAELQKSGILPESEEAQAVAKAWWDMVMEFTGGDMSLLPQLFKFAENKDSWDEKWKQKQAMAERFIKTALGAYFTSLGYAPFGEAEL